MLYLERGLISAQAPVLLLGWPVFLRLEQHLPQLLPSGTEELTNRRIIVSPISPHGRAPALAGEDAPPEHNLDHVGQLDFVLDHGGDAPLQVIHFCIRPPVEALSEP